MTEYELVYVTSEYINRTWQVLQFWASVSFGLIAVSYLAAKRLNMAMTIVLTLLYSAFTVFALNVLILNGEVADGFIADLARTDATTTLVSEGARRIVATAPGTVEMAAIVSAFLGTFAGTIYFLWSSYVSSHKKAV